MGAWDVPPLVLAYHKQGPGATLLMTKTNQGVSALEKCRLKDQEFTDVLYYIKPLILTSHGLCCRWFKE